METLAKTNPLPAGSYRMVIPPSGLPRLAAWTKSNRGKVAVRTCVHGERGMVVSFDVIGKPGAFPFGALGYPAVATSSSTGALLDDVFGSTSELENALVLFALWLVLR